MGFDKWFDDNIVESNITGNRAQCRMAYEAGQQSKQAEIDKLKMSNHYLSVQVLDAEAYAEYWQKRSNESKAEIDALKAKLSQLEKWAEYHIEDYNLSESDSEHDRGWFNAACQVSNLLKEVPNE